MLINFYKCYFHIYKDIKHLVRKNQILNNNFFLKEKMNKHACKTTNVVE
jgi:hypothetical protein